jgi:hypothetical protein
VKVLVRQRAIVTAGFANDVEAVNQYAAVIYKPTARGTADGRDRTVPKITTSRPNVAINSLKTRAGPLRACVENANAGSPNIAPAMATPVTAPAN